ncbi:hypothetical protein DS885_06275 [Psychromonas sp. B3M02]|uniref:hypothetical protein n=1 Tax=Psychromonas sp. B3M02 TaxID=2267226 RepID=UPI000DEA96E8|nr:hypothetical protein [Psychromonas sp. B3M02]RBW46850.1 hypothetical protein DS885_06275 [Psychromonas sp. B3M02]
MSKESVQAQLQENIKIIYHRAVDADQALAELRKQKNATFAHIFAEDTPFKQHANTFLPYVEELAADLQAMQVEDDEQYKVQLPALVVKIELLFKTLNAFKEKLKAK